VARQLRTTRKLDLFPVSLTFINNPQQIDSQAVH